MSAPAEPFGKGTSLGIVLIGALAFIAVLYWLGTGGGATNNGGGHAAGRGLNGYAGLAAMIEADGVIVTRARSKDALKHPGLLVLTPPAGAKGSDIAEIVEARRTIGPTLVVTPKWRAFPDIANPASKRGWTRIDGIEPPEWKGYHDDIGVGLAKFAAHGWKGTGAFSGLSGRLPDDRTVLAGTGPGLQALVQTGDGRILAGYLTGDGSNTALEKWIGMERDPGGDPDEKAANDSFTSSFPVVLVFEPDLLDNWGLADKQTGLMARRLLYAAAGGKPPIVTFDLTLNGLGASRNLLTLAFEPPFLAATLCFFMALFAAGWRSFNRFGPARLGTREIPLGKTVLVRNTAGLIRRARRLRLIAAPYADASRERLVLALGLPRGRPPAETEAAIDRLQTRLDQTGPRYSELAARLRAARRSADVVQRAAALQRLERDLTE
ncbi:DUF4350 domain-containing protein [Novosphingobium sp.]|uniref:DUF4350 domain-containing protein n=1 Tax=Novosphingobium sp. TaxID=1874826 RepID=UPI002635F972|nr:DUF4350 domain-containing protein [Novosphingobium sp.]